MHRGFEWKNKKERTHQGEPDTSGRIILTLILEKGDGGGIDWTHLAQNMDQWRVHVNTLMNIRVP
jgi:hypothetical protein